MDAKYGRADGDGGARLLGLDAVRGFALLGITLVNMQYFAGSAAEAMDHGVKAGWGVLDISALYLVSGLCEAKFFPLYSLLFGIGLAMMIDRARGAGRPWLGPMLMRMLALGAFGAVHAVLVWNGDILFVYACVGAAALLFARASVAVLVVVGCAALLLGTLGIAGWGALNELQMGGELKPIGTPLPAALAEATPVMRYLRGWEYEGGAYMMAAWHSAELEAFGRGPFSQAVALRSIGWGFMLLVTVLSYGWVVLAMFLLGMAALRMGLLSDQQVALRRRAVWWCFGAGVPTGLGGALLMSQVTGFLAVFVASGLMVLAGPLLATGWLCVFLNAGDGAGRGAPGRGLVAVVLDALARVGRLGLTCYLLMSVLATFLMYHWGLGLIGRFGPAAQVGITLGLYAVMVALAGVWTRAVGQGPMERLWRAITRLGEGRAAGIGAAKAAVGGVKVAKP